MKVEHVTAALSSIATNLFNRSDRYEDPDLVHALRTNGGHLRNIVQRLREGFKTDCNHVVVTIYSNKVGKTVIHAYGPFTRAEAISTRKELVEEFTDCHVSFHKIIDVAGTNLYHEIKERK